MRRKLSLLGFLALGLIVALLALQPKYLVGENLCVRAAFTTDRNGQIAAGRYKVVSKDVPSAFEKMITFSGGGHYGMAPIDTSGLETGSRLQAPGGPLESKSDKLTKPTHECP